MSLKNALSIISYYSYKSSSSSIKYYYKISANSSFTYSIIFYEGKNSSGSLYVITDYKDLNLNVNITQVSKNWRTPLPISSSYHKYFYLNNRDYIITDYIYFYLEDSNFGLNCKSIKYCFTDINPYDIYSQSAIAHCSFTTISTYSYQSTSNSTKYYYKIYINSKYYYSIIYYEGRYSSGSLYAYSDYNKLNNNIKIIQVSRNLTTSLPTTSEDKYFYLTNKDYNRYSKYIFLCFEDYDFGLNNNRINYCYTTSDPTPKEIHDRCAFHYINYYSHQNLSSSTKFYYKIPTNNFDKYFIVYYEGKYTPGYLYVTADYNDLNPNVKMTQVYINSRTSLSTSSSDNNYFYLNNSEYSSYSNYIYFYLEDNNFGLRYFKIKYCYTNSKPNSSPYSVVKSCSFIDISSYKYQTSSSPTKYLYKIPTNDSYIYSIVYYEGGNPSGSLYAYSDYKSIPIDDITALSTGAIIGIVIGAIIFLAIIIIIIICRCTRCKKNKTDFTLAEESNYVAPNSSNYPKNKPKIIKGVNKKNFPLQILPNGTN